MSGEQKFSPVGNAGLDGREEKQRGGVVTADAPVSGAAGAGSPGAGCPTPAVPAVDHQGCPRDLALLVEIAAQPVALAAFVDSWLRGQQMNFLRKREFLRDEHARLRVHDFGTMLSWSFGYRPSASNMGLWTPAVAEAHERLVRARIAWLESNPGDDLSPETVERVMGMARRDLARASRLSVAVEWVREVESSGERERSATFEVLERKLSEAMDEVTRDLEQVLRMEDAEFVAELYNRSTRMRSLPRWRRQVVRGDEWPHRLIWLDFGLSRSMSTHAFEYALGAAKSVRDVRRLLAIWHIESRVVVEDGVKVVVGDLGDGGRITVSPC